MSKELSKPKAEQLPSVELRASVKALPLSSGLYAFSVKSATPTPVAQAGNLSFPALHVAPGPGASPNLVEFVGSPKSMGTWLYKPGDRLVVKIEDPGTTLIVSSIWAEGTQPLEINVEHLEGISPRLPASAERPAAAPPQKAGPAPLSASDSALESLKLQLGLHIRNIGDRDFPGAEWAGLLAENLWVEALSVNVLETLSSRDVEYKGLSANSFETPWLSDGAVCGTKGIGMPLIGFAVRLKSEAAALYDCEYSGYFQSGMTVGPLRNGVPCRSKIAVDPLVGVRLRIVMRNAAAKAILPPAAPLAAVASGKGPKFSKFRESVTAKPTRRK